MSVFSFSPSISFSGLFKRTSSQALPTFSRARAICVLDLENRWLQEPRKLKVVCQQTHFVGRDEECCVILQLLFRYFATVEWLGLASLAIWFLCYRKPSATMMSFSH